jgi:hypothetical protein
MLAQAEGNRAVVALTEKGKKTAVVTPVIGVDERQGGEEVLW